MAKTTRTDLNGLILMGGQSSRMGFDKSLIPYHGKPQAQYLFEFVSIILPNTFLSVREEQEQTFSEKVIVDSYEIGGPLNGLLSAHDKDPTKGWLVLAVDFPFITPKSILRLIQNRNTTGMVTALTSMERGLPEPLAAIWEPPALSLLKKEVQKGKEIYPQEFLLENDVRQCYPREDIELFNANNPSDFEKARATLNRIS